MTGKTHQVTALATSIILADMISEPKHKLIFVLGAVVSARLPDIDIKLGIRHRGYTHSITGFLVFSLAIIPLGINAFSIGLIWGYMVHILADSFTVSGVYPFYPNTKYRMRLGKIKTGSKGEIGFLCIVIGSAIGYYYLKLKGV